MSSDFYVVIPARMGSTRFHGKPLTPILGLPMIVRVAQQAQKSKCHEVIVATDHQEIQAVCELHQLHVHMTRSDHPSGTDRIAQVAIERHLPDDSIVVNVQGDEPGISPELIQQVALTLLAHPECVMSTVAHPIKTMTEFINPNIVKVVMDDRQRAIYFSRAPIPYPRDFFMKNLSYFQSRQDVPLPPDITAYRHMGIYAYRVSFLKAYSKLEPSPLEQLESLEQLRLLEHGHQIAMYISSEDSAPGVDLPEDVAKVEKYLEDHPQLQ